MKEKKMFLHRWKIGSNIRYEVQKRIPKTKCVLVIEQYLVEIVTATMIGKRDFDVVEEIIGNWDGVADNPRFLHIIFFSLQN